MKIKFGSSRVVFVTKRYAIKVPNPLAQYSDFLFGFIQNLKERYWLTSDGSYPKNEAQWLHSTPYLARILWADFMGLCVVMERADDVTTQQELEEMFKLLPSSLHTDLCMSNIGRTLDGRLVLRDYGFACRQMYLGRPVIFKHPNIYTANPEHGFSKRFRYLYRPVFSIKQRLRKWLENTFKG